ncbi:hypothetical protein P7K49_020343, partial [Saguinus oedipus]
MEELLLKALFPPPKMQKGKKAKGKKVAPGHAVMKKQEVKKVVNPLFKKPKNFGIEQDISPKETSPALSNGPTISGVNTISTLVENKAQLVVVAHDMDPIELVVVLPALCRKMGVPYWVIKGKARLGRLVHRKTCTTVAFTQ